MPDFQFLQNPLSKIWVILAPRRAKRHDIAHEKSFVCPFCPGNEATEEEVWRIPSIVIPGLTRDLSTHEIAARASVARNDEKKDSSPVEQAQNDNKTEFVSHNDSNWQVRVLKNKFAFAPIHEIIVHSPDHHKNFDELPIDQVERIVTAYKERFVALQKEGEDTQVYIFNNHGQEAGASIPHPHTQLVVLPKEILSNIQPLVEAEEYYETPYFKIFCPETSEWPDEVWVAPKRKDTTFGEIEEEEISDLAIILQRLIQLFTMRHGHEFPFNFYIYPGKNWYLRLMPRVKSLGGFEVGTGVGVNTQDPKETFRCIKSNFANREIEELREEEKADFARGV